MSKMASNSSNMWCCYILPLGESGRVLRNQGDSAQGASRPAERLQRRGDANKDRRTTVRAVLSSLLCNFLLCVCSCCCCCRSSHARKACAYPVLSYTHSGIYSIEIRPVMMTTYRESSKVHEPFRGHGHDRGNRNVFRLADGHLQRTPRICFMSRCW